MLALLAVVLRAKGSDLGLRWPARSVVRWAVAGAIVLGPIGLLVGAVLARPFFGTFSLELGDLWFLLPALVFAVANGASEELAYRGALMSWTGPGHRDVDRADRPGGRVRARARRPGRRRLAARC